jgi:thiol-disulfide isomerase/thioredoxin
MEDQPTPDQPSDTEAETASAGAEPKSRNGWLIGTGIVFASVILVLQVLILFSLSDTDQEVSSLSEAVAGLEDSVAGVDAKVDEIEAASSVQAPGPPAAAPTQALPPGYLPRYESGQQDQALGLVLGEVTASEHYSQSTMTIDPADGTARAWLVWAHWCPYCQQELPAVTAWWEATADQYPNVEIISLTTSIDPSKGNPLVPYLEELQLSFPVLVDEDLTLAGQFGVSAFPFWVFTDGSGTVRARAPGLIGIEAVAAVVGDLNDLGA